VKWNRQAHKKALGNGRLRSKGLCEENASQEDATVFLFLDIVCSIF